MRRERVAIIGAGRVGRGLGLRLREAGWKLGAVVTRGQRSALEAVRHIGGGTPMARLTRRVLDAGAILITVPDRAIAGVARELAGIGGAELRGMPVLHTSGALAADVLAALAQRGASTGALHPMQTFGGRARTSLQGVLFGIEGGAEALRVARRMVRSLGGVAVRIAPGRKAEYHCAGTFAATNVLASLEAGVALLVAAGLSRGQAVRSLLGIARQTLENRERLGPRAAWTGPLSRGDYSTVALHWAALKRHPREFRQAYAAMARLAARMLAESPEKTLKQLGRVVRANPRP